MFYDTNIFLSHTFSKNKLGVEFFIDFFNKIRQQALFMIAIYKSPQILNTNFFIFKNIVTKIPTNCPTIIIRDFNINMLAYTTKSITLQNSMNTHNFHITFIEST
jgi:hypothetical protein